MHHRSYWLAVSAFVCLWATLARAQRVPCMNLAGCTTCNLGLYKYLLIQYETSDQYDRDIAKVIAEAKAYLSEQRSRKGKRAIVLDIDETSPSNWPEMQPNDFGVFPNGACTLAKDGSVLAPCGLIAWIGLGRDMAIAPTLALYSQARREGMRIFFITGRHESQRAITTTNLRNAGYTGWTDDDLKMESDNARLPSAAYFKSAERKKISESGYIIVLNVGDQESDLAGGFAEQTIKLPNPFYFIP